MPTDTESAPSTALDELVAQAHAAAARRGKAARRAADPVVDLTPQPASAGAGEVPVFTVRYSTERIEEFLSQGDLTLKPYAHDPNVVEILAHLRELVGTSASSEALREAWGVERLVFRQRHTGWLIVRGRNWCVAGMEPASQDTAGKGESAWVHSFAGVIRRAAKRGTPVVIAPEIGRVCRRPMYAAPLEAALVETRAIVRTAKLPPDFRLADHVDGGWGRQAWDAALAEAGVDWSATVRRLSAGGAAQLGAGRWPFAEKELPRGWRMRRGPYGLVLKPHVTEPKVEFAPILRDVIELGLSSRSNRELCHELARRHGSALATAALLRDHGSDATLADVKHPDVAVRNLYAHMPVYVTGTIEVSGRLGLVEHGLTELHGMPIEWHRDDLGREYAVVKNTVRLGTDEATGNAAWWGIDPFRALEAFEKRAQRTERPPIGPRQRTKPLAGYACTVGSEEFRIGGPRQRSYVILQRPVEKGRHAKTERRVGWDNATPVASVPAGLVHRRFVDALIDALEQGVSGTLLPLDDAPTEVDPEVAAELSRLDAAIADRNEEARVFERRKMTDALEEVTAELAELARRRAEVQEGLLVTRAVGATTTIPAVLAYLRGCDGQADRAFCDALRDIVPALVSAEASPTTVRLGFRVIVATDEGTVTVGPVVVTLPNSARKAEGAPVHGLRSEELARRFLCEGLSLEKIAADAGWDAPTVERRVREWLAPFVPSKGLRAAVLDCPVLEARKALGCHLFSTPLPPHISRDFARLILRTYTQELEWPMAWAADTHLRRRSALAYVAAYDRGDGVVFADMCNGLSIDAKLGRIFTWACAPGGRGSGSTSLDYGPTLVPVEKWSQSSHWPEERKRVRIARCPHPGCDGLLDHVLRVPELGVASILCSSCRRSPADRRLVFPEAYLRLWEGPRGSDRVGKGRVSGRTGTTEGFPVPVPAAWEARTL